MRSLHMIMKKHIYVHIIRNEECAQFYVLDDERKKYRYRKENYRKRQREEQGEEYKAKIRQYFKDYRQNLTEEKRMKSEHNNVFTEDERDSRRQEKNL